MLGRLACRVHGNYTGTQVSGVHVAHTNDRYVTPQEVRSALLLSGEQLAVVINYEENTDKIYHATPIHMNRSMKRGISTVRNRIRLFLAIAGVCLGCSADPLCLSISCLAATVLVRLAAGKSLCCTPALHIN